jgi:hypothetical protein
MAAVNVIIAKPGPLPIKVTAQIQSDGPAIVTLAGSVWSTTPNQMIGVALLIDGQRPPITASIFSNGPSTHRAVVPVSVPYTFTFGQHTFELAPATGATTSDGNDFFNVSVQY